MNNVKFCQRMGFKSFDVHGLRVMVNATFGKSEIRIESGSKVYYEKHNSLVELFELVRAMKANKFFEDSFREIRGAVRTHYEFYTKHL